MCALRNLIPGRHRRSSVSHPRARFLSDSESAVDKVPSVDRIQQIWAKGYTRETVRTSWFQQGNTHGSEPQQKQPSDVLVKSAKSGESRTSGILCILFPIKRTKSKKCYTIKIEHQSGLCKKRYPKTVGSPRKIGVTPNNRFFVVITIGNFVRLILKPVSP